jgi:hypothetical protein
VAQLGARLNGIQEVRGSNPLASTFVKLFSTPWKTAETACFPGFFVGRAPQASISVRLSKSPVFAVRRPNLPAQRGGGDRFNASEISLEDAVLLRVNEAKIRP